MRREAIFEGIATALITPMTKTGVDYDRFGALIDWQIEQGIDALVICGTTGEGSTLSDAEHKEAVRYSVERAAGRVPIIAGTGSNDTAYGIQLTQYCYEVGADAALLVTPYYNKATQEGLYRMYKEYADACPIPIILYNVPSRTGVNIEPATYQRLMDIETVVGIKEANSDISKIVDTMARVGDTLTLYSGNDDQIVPLMSLGGKGCISVLSNVLPKETREICTRYFNGDIEGAAELQFKYNELVSALFCEVNPIPVKFAMAAMGWCEPVVRSPLCEMAPANYERLLNAMRNVGIEV